MLQWLLARLGFGVYLPPLPGGSSDVSSEGPSQFRYIAGRGDEDDAGWGQQGEPSRTPLADPNAVWPGRHASIEVVNKAPVPMRYTIRVTDLDPALYSVSAEGGLWETDPASTIVDSGGTARFTIQFTDVASHGSAAPRSFRIVQLRSDPNRLDDRGTVVGTHTLKWLPRGGDGKIKLLSRPKVVLTRPWRRAALFELHVRNGEHLPPHLELKIIAAKSKKELDKSELELGTIIEDLPPLTPRTWRCQVAPPDDRSSYVVTVRGTSTTADGSSHKVSLEEPFYVRYMPWLRMARDWVFLASSLFVLCWIVWGIPVKQRPIVSVKVTWPDEDSARSLADLDGSKLILTGGPSSGSSVEGVADGNALVFRLRARWYGYRWPWPGWNGWSDDPLRFKLRLIPADAKREYYRRYDLENVYGPDGRITFSIPTDKRPLLGLWEIPVEARVALRAGVRLKLSVVDLGPAQGQAQKIRLTFTLDGVEVPGAVELAVPPNGRLLWENVPVGVEVHGDQQLVVTATTLPYQVVTKSAPKMVHARSEPYDVRLSFAGVPTPTKMLSVKGPAEGFKITLIDLDSGDTISLPNDGLIGGPQATLNIAVVKEGTRLMVTGRDMQGRPLAGGDTLTLSTDPNQQLPAVQFTASGGPATEANMSD